jgi:solute:Na+ symporter, SSS family
MPTPVHSPGFGLLDWAVVALALVVATAFGAWASRRMHSRRDFFLGGRQLPWWAVSMSVVSAQLTGSSFIALPALVYTGDMRFFLFPLIGGLVSRFIVAFWLLPAFYRREIYSPYQFVARRLGPGVLSAATALFVLGCVLGESARLYVMALLVQVLLAAQLAPIADFTGLPPIALAIFAIATVSIAWTLLGGIVSVVWTDVLMTLLFTVGAVSVLVFVVTSVDGGLATAYSHAAAAGKLRLLDFPPPPRLFTDNLVTVLAIASIWSSIGGLATSQDVTQRLLCCADVRKAQWAVIMSWLGIVVPLSGMLAGAGLFVFYNQHPMSPESAALLSQRGDYVVPLFIRDFMPAGLAGLIVAAVFAAAIPTSALAALAQVSLSLGRKPKPDSAHPLLASRLLVAFWGVVLAVGAISAAELAQHYRTAYDLTVALTGYVMGPLLAGLVLALTVRKARRGDLGRGWMFAAALAVTIIWSVQWHSPLSLTVLCIALAALSAAVLSCTRRPKPLLALAAGISLALLCHHLAFSPGPAGKLLVLAPNWYVLLGSLVTFAFTPLFSHPIPRRLR